MKLGVAVSQVLQTDLYADNTPLNDRKERLKALIQDLDLDLEKLGTTLEERTSIILNTLNTCTEHEFNALSATGFKELFSALQNHFPSLSSVLKQEFELEEQEELDVEKLRALSITPYDILYMLTNDEVKAVVESMGIKKRGNLRLNILNLSLIHI